MSSIPADGEGVGPDAGGWVGESSRDRLLEASVGISFVLPSSTTATSRWMPYSRRGTDRWAVGSVCTPMCAVSGILHWIPISLVRVLILVALHDYVVQLWLLRRARSCCRESCMQSWIFVSSVKAGGGGHGMWLVGGGSASSKRAFRYGVGSGGWCGWRLEGALVSSGRG